MGTGWVAVLLPWVAVAEGAVEAVGGGDAEGEIVPEVEGGSDTPAVALLGPGCAGREPRLGPEFCFPAAAVRSPLTGAVCPLAPLPGRWSPAVGTGRRGESTEGPPRTVLSSSAT